MEIDHIHTLSISTPFPVGKINVYFIDGATPTLIDAPPRGDVYINELERALKRRGYSIRDIKRIIITHPHFDHFGAAAELVGLSKAEVWVSKEGARYVEHFDEEYPRDYEYYTEIMRKAGAPDEPSSYLEWLYKWARTYGCSVPVSRLLNDGDQFDLGSTSYRVKTVPGHSPYCILLYSQNGNVAFSGDFLLKGISSNALIQRPDATSLGYKSLRVYLDSLKKVRRMGIPTALPGHGEVVKDVTGRIDELIGFINQRKELVRNILGQGPRRLFSIVETLLPDLPREQLFLGVSEVVGYLELLESEGIALQVEDGYWLAVKTPRAVSEIYCET